MKENKEKKYYNQWWFWVIILLIVLVLVGGFISDCSEEIQLTQDYCEYANSIIEFSNLQTDYINTYIEDSEQIEQWELLDC